MGGPEDSGDSGDSGDGEGVATAARDSYTFNHWSHQAYRFISIRKQVMPRC